MLNPLRLLSEYKTLNEEVLGLNRRNLEFIKKLNPPIYRKYVDNKLLCKRLFKKHKIPTPKTIKVIRSVTTLEKIDWNNLPRSFVVKPARGTHGRGILVLFGKRKDTAEWIGADGKIYTPSLLKEHITNILNGYYSMGGVKDFAYFEERIKVHPVLKPYTYKGIPDIRVIVYRKIPIMAMLRLPTRRSRGTANLHAGAVSVGIDLRYGITTHAIVLKEVDLLSDRYDVVNVHPDYPYLKLSGLKIPYWNEILELAIKAQKASKMGYVGVDITIDRERGPLVIEVNARPGLGIQVANAAGLLERINAVYKRKVKTTSRAIEIAKTLFGGEIEEEVEAITGKQILGLVENVVLYASDNVKLFRKKAPLEYKKHFVKLTEIPVKAKIDTGALYSSVDYNVALKLGYWELMELQDIFKESYKDIEQARKRFEEVKATYEGRFKTIIGFKLVRSGSANVIRPIIEIPTLIRGELRKIIYTVADRSHLLYPVIIGRRDLKGYLVDPSMKLIRRK